MRKFMLCILIWGFPCWGYAGDSGISELIILHEQTYLTFGIKLQQSLHNEQQQQAALDTLERLHLGVRKLAPLEIRTQLSHILAIRGFLKLESLEDVLLSELLGVIITDAMNVRLVEMESFLFPYERTPSAIPEPAKAFLQDLARVGAQNMVLTAKLRPLILKLTGNSDEVQEAFRAMIEEAEQRSKDLYLEKWGKNVLAIQQARGIEDLPQGLASLYEHAATRWRDIIEDPTGMAANTYFLAVDLYTAQCLVAFHQLFDTFEIPHTQAGGLAESLLLWERELTLEPVHSGKLLALTTDMQALIFGRNRLILGE